MSRRALLLLCIVAVSANARRLPCHRNERVLAKNVAKILDGAVSAKFNRALQYHPKTRPGHSSKAVIVHRSGRWLVRLDRPHRHIRYHHININRRLTGHRDPHIRISNKIFSAGAAVGKVISRVSRRLVQSAVLFEGFRLVSAIRDDRRSHTTSRTKETLASIGGSYIGGFGGAPVGSTVGGWVGGAIGAIFGGACALPGSALGSMVGGFVGGVGGSIVGNDMAIKLVEKQSRWCAKKSRQ